MKTEYSRSRPWAYLQSAARAALLPGSVASVSSSVALAICSKTEEDHAAGALNGPSQWLWGEEEAYTQHATLRHTAVGYAIHHLTSIFWATLHELTFERRAREEDRNTHASKSAARLCAEAAATAGTAYVVDYYLTPRRLRPGFEKHLGPLSMFAVYAAFGAGLAAVAIARRRTRRGRSATVH